MALETIGGISLKRVEPVEYPETDGQPMAETEWHVMAIFNLTSALTELLRDRSDLDLQVDMFLYYEEGNPRARRAPDVMVVKGAEKRMRRVFKTWEEEAVPWVMFEVTSESTWVEDLVTKSVLYARLGVREYFLFDPLDEYLERQLMGFRLEDGLYTPLTVMPDGSLRSEELEVILRPEDWRLRVIDARTGRPLPMIDELVGMAETETARAEREAARAEEEAARATAAEAEIERLRTLVEELQGPRRHR